MFMEAIAVEPLQVQRQGALSRAFEKPPAGERSVMLAQTSLVVEAT